MIDFNSIRHESIHIVSITDQLKPCPLRFSPKAVLGWTNKLNQQLATLRQFGKIFHDIRSPNVFNNKGKQ
jgi:hypothetical protein